MKKVEGILSVGKNQKFALVVSRFNEFMTSKLLDGARDCLVRHGAQDNNITAVWVPGAFELTPICNKLANSGKFDAIVALGAVIRGSTPHFDHIANSVSRGISDLASKASIPVVFGVLTTDTIEQALERAGTKAGNKGWDSALSAIEMCSLMDQIK